MTWTPRHHLPLPNGQMRISLRTGEPVRMADGALLMFFADRVDYPSGASRYVLQLVLVPLSARDPSHSAHLPLDGRCELGAMTVRCATSYVDEQMRVQLVDLLLEPATTR